VIETHEASLAASLQRAWDPETAAVYADVLTSRGDPRGELIMIDLAEHTDALLDRKRELIQAWVGDEIAGWTWQPHDVGHGLLRGFAAATTGEHTMAGHLATLFTAVGPHVSNLSLHGSSVELSAAIDVISDLGLPWLHALSIHRSNTNTPIDKQVWERLIDATPNLRELSLIGHSIAVSPIHPAIDTLRLQGLAIAIGKQPIASVTHLDFAFAANTDLTLPSVDQLAAMVNPRAFPVLRTLDLSRNLAPRAGAMGPRTAVLDVLGAIEQLERFEHVRIPDVVDEATMAALVVILVRCPGLVIELAKVYQPLESPHPRLIIPSPRP